ncbi:hypothetical protein RhiirA5_369748 [Rhizophagus irregularis]|uniref:Uncharacterized protein n=1 Tax=Rhizophagus irregularis TaxID=588596 RepID=A0A2N0SIH1_9GLOM|nr:hypothetical protein RhiirA5_369748 [Rhizophagus irregularis]PKC75341.1 hypothetical protein RhiirA1_387405 [Rhizophagus irregularis]
MNKNKRREVKKEKEQREEGEMERIRGREGGREEIEGKVDRKRSPQFLILRFMERRNSAKSIAYTKKEKSQRLKERNNGCITQIVLLHCRNSLHFKADNKNDNLSMNENAIKDDFIVLKYGLDNNYFSNCLG